jgi:ankyrin repeat protein
LVASGARIDERDNEGRSPIFFAVSYGHEELVRYLLKQNASTKIQNNKGETVLDIARKTRQKGLFNILNAA